MKKILFILISLVIMSSLYAKPVKNKILSLTSDNTLILNTTLTSESVGKLMKEAAILDAKLKSGYPLNLFLYTPGGSIQDGLELFEFLAGLNRPINTITLFAASMGFQTVHHLGKRYILKYGTLMSHKARGGFSGEFGDGVSQLDSRYGLWLRRISEMDRQTVRRTKGKQTLKTYRDAYSNELWLNGWEAVKQGYADKIVVAKCGESLKGKTFDRDTNFMGFKLTTTFDRCPINQNPLNIRLFIYTNKGEMDLNTFINKSGKFGPKCRYTSSKKENTYYGGSEVVEKKSELCASNTSLTLKKIIAEKTKLSKYLVRDLRFHIKYSY